MATGPATHARRAVRGWALLDLVVTAAFALPPLLPLFLDGVYAVNGALGGADTPPPVAPLHAFFICLAGALGVLWALVRIRTPTATLGASDAIGRLWVGLLIVYFVGVAGAPRVLLLFVLSELAGALHQAVVLRRSVGMGDPTTGPSP